ncbi:hypothetical protein NDI45_26720 [Leptolyngbya sp. GB1-A1]|uniref:hypothetical protein n=1 Tax=Leptolyngbya sp. GB1-A1 TaxID=2933908 RepID=UPI003298EF42
MMPQAEKIREHLFLKLQTIDKTNPMTSNFLSPIGLNQRLNKSLMLSSQQLGWNGILVEQHQNSSTLGETKLPGLSDHWFVLLTDHPAHFSQKRGKHQCESITQLGDSSFVPAGQPSHWRCCGAENCHPTLHIFLKPSLITQVAEASAIDTGRLNSVNRFGKQDLNLQHIAMLLLAELHSASRMGRLYIESLTQALAIHLLRHYSIVPRPVTLQNRRLTRVQLQ